MLLQELRLKWGSYKTIDCLSKLTYLRYLFIGSGASIENIEVFEHLGKLEVLFLENIKLIKDFTVLGALKNVKQLSISGSLYNTAIIENLDFINDMQSLQSIILRNARVIHKDLSTMVKIKERYNKIIFL
jgi:hypothetical protein